MYICLLDRKFLYEEHFNKYVALIEKHVIAWESKFVSHSHQKQSVSVLVIIMNLWQVPPKKKLEALKLNGVKTSTPPAPWMQIS